MIATILSFIPGGGLTAILAAVVAAIGWGFSQRLAGAKAERNSNKAKEADALEKHYQEIAAASRARNSVDPVGMPDRIDPYRRD